MIDKELKEVYYQTDHLQAGIKVIKELHKIKSIRKEDVRLSLAKEAL